MGELELSHQALASVRAYDINPVASGGGFHLRYDGAVGVTLFNEPQLFAGNFVRGKGSQALTGHYLVYMLPQSDLPLGEEPFVASGRKVIPRVGATNFEAGDILDVGPLMCIPLDALHHNGRPSGPCSYPLAMTSISAVTASLLTAAAATASPSPALRSVSKQRASFLRVWERLPSYLRAVAFDHLQANSWVMFSATLLTFSPSPTLILAPTP